MITRSFARFLFAVSFVVLCSHTWAQVPDADAIYNLKTVRGPSPTAAALGKYAEWPVNLNTGIPSIDIPLYEIKGRSLSLPISVSYHSSGIKVTEVSSWVGTGWSLNAGGAITRSVRGLPDECGGVGYFTVRTSSNFPDKNTTYENVYPPSLNWKGFVKQACENEVDGVHDAYHLNAMGRSYRLMFKYNGPNLQVETIPFSNIKVTTDWTTWGVNDGTWTVTTEDGTVLVFGGNNGTTDYYVESTDHPKMMSPCGREFPTSWYLKSITSPTKEQILFKYATPVTSAEMVSTVSYDDWAQYQGIGAITHTTTPRVKSETQIYKILTLDRIDWEAGYIQFTRNGTARVDLPGSNALASFSVYQKTGGIALVDKYSFVTRQWATASTNEYQPTGNPDYPHWRLMLDAIIHDGQGTVPNIQRWDFAYNPLQPPSTMSTSQDHYGYYNGASNTHLLPGYTLDAGGGRVYTFPGNADRTPTATYMQAGILTSITYPTKGRSEFTYESNQSGATLLGGLRILSIIDKPDGTTANDVKRYFEYANSMVLYPVSNSDYLQEFPQIMDGAVTATRLVRSGQTRFGLGSTGGAVIGYGKVFTKYGPNTENGKLQSCFYQAGDGGGGPPNVIPYPDPDPREYARGLLRSEVYLDKDGNKLRASFYTYTFGTISQLVFFKAYRQQYYSPSQCVDPEQFCGYSPLSTTLTNQQVKKINARQTTYVKNGAMYDSVSTYTTYDYETIANARPTKTTTTDSKENTMVTIERTVFERAAIVPALAGEDLAAAIAMEQPTVSTPTGLNMVGVVLQKVELLGTTELSKITTQFKRTTLTPSVIVSPDRIESKIGNAPVDIRVQFMTYDEKTNLLEQKKASDVVHSYVYDYSKNYVIAEATNAGQNEMAHTSFEGDNFTGWSGAINPVTTYAYTGTKSHAISAGSPLSRTGLPSGAYKVSLWATTATTGVTINGAVPESTVTRGAWKLYEKTFWTPITSVVISATGYVDEIRIHPPTGQMSTATYKPLIGISSETDAANNTIYYEYDGYNRLINVRDDKGNLLKSFNYHFKTTPY